MPDQRTDWPTLFALFGELIELPENQRWATLDRLSAEQPRLRERLTRLLSLDALGDTLIADVESWRGWLADTAAAAEPAPSRIGPWRIGRLLGEGGMGRVFLAQRADDHYEHQCALKLIRGEFVSDRALSKFVRERRILARLNHPGIAQLFDGGVDDHGRPWFAMRYVDGMPLTAYCNERKLGLRTRIRLLLDVSEAVAYAHRQFVLHCDLKPSNILVDRDGRPHLVDFGIARMLEGHDLIEAGNHSTINAMSPGYSAPEQINGQPLTVASDVYSLGAILYELLTGMRPYAGSDSTAAAVAVAHSQGEPRPPSRVGSGKPIARAHLRGDLDVVVATALRHDPANRYQSAEAFAADLKRYLRGRPLLARGDDPAYSVRMFIKRHWLGLSTLVSVVAFLVVSIFCIAYESAQVRAEAGVARAVKDFLVDVLAGSEPDRHPGREISARELLDAGAAQLDRDDRISTPLRAELTAVLSHSYAALGAEDESEKLARRVLTLCRSADGEHALQTARARLTLASILAERDSVTNPGLHARHDEAEALARQALQDLGDATTIESVQAHVLLARLRAQDGAVGLAEAQTAVAIAKQLPHADAVWLGRANYALAMAFLQTGDAPEAEEAAHQALEVLHAAGGTNGKEARKAHALYATLLMHLGRSHEAVEQWREVLAAEMQVYGAESLPIVDTTLRLASALGNDGQGADAQAIALQAVALARRLNFSPDRLRAKLRALGDIAALRGDFVTARTSLDEAVRQIDGAVPAAIPPSLLGRWRQVRTIQAEPGALEEYEQFAATIDSAIPSARMAQIHLGAGYLAVGKPEQALGHYSAAESGLKAEGREAQDVHSLASLGMAAAYLQQGRYVDAQERLDAIDTTQISPSSFLLNSIALMRHLVAVRSGHCAGAVEGLHTIVAARATMFGEDSVWTAEAHMAYAEAALACATAPTVLAEERSKAQALLARMLDPSHVEVRTGVVQPSPSEFW